MRLFLLSTFFILSISGNCQTGKIRESRFYNISEVGYGSGIGNINFSKANVKVKNDSYYVRLRTQFGYSFNDKFSFGIGFGLDGYHDYTFNTAPLFLDTRYYFKSRPRTLFIFSNLGYSIRMSSNFEQGFMGGFSIGQRRPLKRIALLPSIGINVQQIQGVGYYNFSQSPVDNINLISVQFNLGFLF
jgi:hypothetical protein